MKITREKCLHGLKKEDKILLGNIIDKYERYLKTGHSSTSNFLDKRKKELIKTRLPFIFPVCSFYSIDKICEKCILCIGNNETGITLYYSQSPNMKHNEILATLFQLGFEVDTIGDIWVEQDGFYLTNLTRLNHYLEDNFVSEHFADTEIRNIIEDLIAFNEEIDDPADIYSDQYKEAIKRSFLSAECNKVFGRKIYMEGLQLKDICKALKSPISELHTYEDDLLEEYISSDHFINSVAGHISESLIGLHDLDDAVREVSDYDSKRIKVYKKESLLSLNNGKN